MNGSPLYWAIVGALTLAFALVDLDALSKRRAGKIHAISVVVYIGSFGAGVVYWYLHPSPDKVVWVFPAAVRIAVAVVLVGGRAIAISYRREQALGHLHPHPKASATARPTLTAEELRAAETYDAEWQAEQHHHDVARPADEQVHATDEARFQRIVREALDELPADIRREMSNVAVVVEDEPPRGQRLLGLYRGVPLTRRSHYYAGVLPDKITIYRGPLERHYGADPAELRRQVRRTVRHEIAHHFGITDQRLVDIDRY